MKFDRNLAFRIDLSKSDVWSPIFSIPELCEMFKDGRLFGKLAEHILVLEFENLELSREGGPFDLISETNEAIEVKSLTRGGFDTSPSCLLGAGRSYSYERHLERLQYINSKNGYYILADNRELPVVTFYPVAATEQLIFTNTRERQTGKRTSVQADVFLDKLCLSVIDLN